MNFRIAAKLANQFSVKTFVQFSNKALFIQKVRIAISAASIFKFFFRNFEYYFLTNILYFQIFYRYIMLILKFNIIVSLIFTILFYFIFLTIRFYCFFFLIAKAMKIFLHFLINVSLIFSVHNILEISKKKTKNFTFFVKISTLIDRYW